VPTAFSALPDSQNALWARLSEPHVFVEDQAAGGTYYAPGRYRLGGVALGIVGRIGACTGE